MVDCGTEARVPEGICVRSGAGIYGNVVVRQKLHNGAIKVWQTNRADAQDIRVHHNTIYAAEAAGVEIGEHGGQITAADNLVWRCGSGNFHSDPLFTDPDALDFTLRPGSPADGLGAYRIGEPLRRYAIEAEQGDEEPLPPPGPKVILEILEAHDGSLSIRRVPSGA